MGLYDGDGGIEYAQKQFRDARDRAEKAEDRRRKKDRRDRIKDFLIDSAVAPLGESLNEIIKSNFTDPLTEQFTSKSAFLDDKNIPFKTWLQNHSNNALKYTTNAVYDPENNPNGYIVDGKVDENKYRVLQAAALRDIISGTGEFAGLTKDNSSYASFLNSIITGSDFQAEIADAQRAYDEGLDIPDPDMSILDANKYLNRINGSNPFQRFSNFARKVIGIETPETLDYKNLESSETLQAELAKVYGEDVAREMAELNQASKSYQERMASLYGSSRIDGILIKLRDAITSGQVKGKITKIGEPVTREVETGFGTQTRIVIPIEGIDVYGNPTYREETDVDAAIGGLSPTPEIDAKEIDDLRPLMQGVLVNLIRNPTGTGQDVKLKNNRTLKQTLRYGVEGEEAVFDAYVDKASTVYYSLKRFPAYNAFFNDQGISDDELRRVSAQFVIDQVKKGSDGVDPLTNEKLDPMVVDNLLRANNTKPYLYEIISTLNNQQILVGNDIDLTSRAVMPALFADIANRGENNSEAVGKILRNNLFTVYNMQSFIDKDFEKGKITNIEDLPNFIRELDGETVEQKLLNYEITVKRIINATIPPALSEIRFDIEDVVTTPTTEVVTEETGEETGEETTPTPTPTPTPTTTQTVQTKSMTDMDADELDAFIDEKRGEILGDFFSNIGKAISSNQLNRSIERAERAISNIENNRMVSYNSSAFRRYVEEQTQDNFDFNMPNATKLTFLKDFVLTLKRQQEESN